MGYTHYMKPMKRELSLEERSFIIKIIEQSGVEIVSGNGEEGTEPVVEKDSINLNGVGDDSHESFNINTTLGDFCKTNRKPYDVVVVAILYYLESKGVITWSSDGGREDHEGGIELFAKVLGVPCV